MEEEIKKEQREAGPTVIIQQAPVNPTNGLGTAGFVLALLAVIFCWVPGLDWVLWILGLVLSLVGVFRQPRGLAIAGLVLSCLGLIIMIVLLGAFAAAVAAL